MINEKPPILPGYTVPKKPSASPLRQAIRLVLALMVCYTVYKVPTLPMIKESLSQPPAIGKVPLEVHIIAKCGNAKVALTELVLPTIERVHDKVDFKLSYIAKSLVDGEVECKHGPEECEASIFELCAQDLYSDPLTRVGFVECLTADFERIPDRAFYEDCAAKHSINLDEVDRCVGRDGGEYGYRLLRDSVQHSIDVGARISGTIRLNEEIYCIRDKGFWRDCPNGGNVGNLVNAIEHSYNVGTEL